MANYIPTLKTTYKEQIKPALMKEFGYKSIMQVPKLEKIVINQGMGQAVADKKLIEVAQAELTQITGQKAVQTRSRNVARRSYVRVLGASDRSCTSPYPRFQGYQREVRRQG